MTSSDALARQLFPGETVLWTGRSFPGVVVRPADAFLIPFSLLWAGFAVVWNAGVWSTGAPLLFKLWGLPFLLAGAYFTFGRFLLDIRQRQRLLYAVTDRRVLIVTDRTTTSLDRRTLPVLEVTESPDGSGTIRFGSGPGWLSGRNVAWQASSDPVPQFIRIPDARVVHRLLLEERPST